MKPHLSLAIGLALAGSLHAAPPPHIVVVMVDDLGWNHINAEKGTLGTAPALYHTPHIERLAREGLSFTHAYTQPNCAPTRAAMLSGQYPARVHNDVYVVGHLNRYGRGGVSKEEARFRGPEQTEDVAAAAVTVAEALKENGYATAHLGKYHVGGHSGPETLPSQAGFDINLGGHQQGHQPTCFASKQKGDWGFKGVGRGDFDRFAAPYDAAYLQRRGLPASLDGTPKHICDALGDALEETVVTLHASGEPFYLQFHPYAVHTPIKARPDLLEQALPRANGDQSMAEYQGFIAGMDENIGRLLAVLEDPNRDGDPSDSIARNTLVLFTSDNGGYRGGNAPLRGLKGMFTEGGIRVPLIARWPGVIPADTVTDRLVHSVDYYPTYLDLAGRKWTPPKSVHPLDGTSFAAALRAPQAAAPRGPIFFLFPGYMDRRADPCTVVIDDLDNHRWKLRYDYEPDAWTLHDLTHHPAEQHNVIDQYPQVAKTLSDRLHAWLDQEHPTWQPKFPIRKTDAQPVRPPRL